MTALIGSKLKSSNFTLLSYMPLEYVQIVQSVKETLLYFVKVADKYWLTTTSFSWDLIQLFQSANKVVEHKLLLQLFLIGCCLFCSKIRKR